MRAATHVACAAAASAALLLAPHAVRAQDVPEKELPKADALVKDGVRAPFGGVALADGRLLFGQRGGAIDRADFASGKVEKAVGAGPEENEFRFGGVLMRWAGDSIALPDAGKGRLMILGPDGAYVRSIRIGDPLPVAPAAGAAPAAPAAAPGPRLPNFRHAAPTTHLIGTGFPARASGPPNPTVAPQRVPFPIVRFSLASLTYDTVVQLMPAQQPRPSIPPGSTGTMTLFVPTVPFQAVDTWVGYRDGTVGVVRAGSYRMDFIAPDGSRTQGEPIPFPKVPVSDGEKKAFMTQWKKQTEEAIRRSPQRVQIATFNYEEPSSWPATHPPFRSDVPAMIDADERLWLQVRCAKDEKAACYDVIDRSGTRVERYRAPQQTTVFAAGKGVVYTIDAQKDDRLVLQRHTLK